MPFKRHCILKTFLWIVFLRKLLHLLGDGASVNTGHLNGVIAHFRRNVSPSIIMVQCMSHRVELAYKAALKVRELNQNC